MKTVIIAKTAEYFIFLKRVYRKSSDNITSTIFIWIKKSPIGDLPVTGLKIKADRTQEVSPESKFSATAKDGM